MMVFPHAKINLGLNVLRKREDGFHEIQSVMVPIPLLDVLEAVVDPELPANSVDFTRSGTIIPGEPEDDLCWKAVCLIQEERNLPGFKLHLHKVIPMGAGLGGGSSDGAHTLLLLNNLLDLGIDTQELKRMAERLGSDCPFFLNRTIQFAQGRGERLEPYELNLDGLYLLVIAPGIHVSTPEAYRGTVPTGAIWNPAATLTRSRLLDGSALVSNSMEAFVFEKHPVIEQIKSFLVDQGAVHAAMSGSGSTVFGIFTSVPKLDDELKPYRNWTFKM